MEDNMSKVLSLILVDRQLKVNGLVEIVGLSKDRVKYWLWENSRRDEFPVPYSRQQAQRSNHFSLKFDAV